MSEMRHLEVKTVAWLTLPILAFLFFVFWSKNHSAPTNFRIVKNEIAWETEHQTIIVGNIESMKFEKIFCHRVVVNYPTPFLASYRPGGSQAFLRLGGPKPRALNVKTLCTDAKGIAVPCRDHVEWNDIGEATSDTEYNIKDLRSASGPLLLHVSVQWNDGSKPIHLPAKIVSPAALKTSEGFSLDLNSP